MQRRVLRTGLTLLVSTTVFLGAIMPPALPHAHSEGDQTHHHHAAHSEVYAASHSHPHPHKHPHSHEGIHQADPVGMPMLHVHLTLLGLDFQLPVSIPQNAPSDRPSLPDAQIPSLVRLFDAETLLKASVPVGLIDGVALPGTWVAIPSAKPILQSWGQALASLPLCDSARGERSGVQLI